MERRDIAVLCYFIIGFLFKMAIDLWIHEYKER